MGLIERRQRRWWLTVWDDNRARSVHDEKPTGPLSYAEAVEVVPASQLQEAVEERDVLRAKLDDVGRWLSSGNFAGWEMVVQDIEATRARPGGQ
jgi:hypothetical protein